MKPAVKAALSRICLMYIGVNFCIKQEDVSALFYLKCAIVYGIREVPANEKSLKLNETLETVLC